jgi:GDPmannose 4,6-dehydratase
MEYVASLKTALITGVTGQDGRYLANLLRVEGYDVTGTTHRAEGLAELNANLGIKIIFLDLTDLKSITNLVAGQSFNEIYNLAARASSMQLNSEPLLTSDVNGIAALRFLEAIRQHSPLTRFCQAASSELFVGAAHSPQDESFAYYPRNAYGAAKGFAAHMVSVYRDQYNLFACTAILFNHESPLRGFDYVTRKISSTVAQIALARREKLILGSLDSRRDWGHAKDYVRAMWLMLQQPQAQDFVVATGTTRSVREFCQIAFAYVGLDYQNYVELDPAWQRRVESVELRGDATKAKEILNWEPHIDFTTLVHEMVQADLEREKPN